MMTPSGLRLPLHVVAESPGVQWTRATHCHQYVLFDNMRYRLQWTAAAIFIVFTSGSIARGRWCHRNDETERQTHTPPALVAP